MRIKVCASINLGPFNHEAIMFDSIAAAVDYFRSEIAGVDFGTGTDEQVMDLYPQCDGRYSANYRCYSGATFHDYPMVRYAVPARVAAFSDRECRETMSTEQVGVIATLSPDWGGKLCVVYVQVANDVDARRLSRDVSRVVQS